MGSTFGNIKKIINHINIVYQQFQWYIHYETNPLHEKYLLLLRLIEHAMPQSTNKLRCLHTYRTYYRFISEIWLLLAFGESRIYS